MTKEPTEKYCWNNNNNKNSDISIKSTNINLIWQLFVCHLLICDQNWLNGNSGVQAKQFSQYIYNF